MKTADLVSDGRNNYVNGLIEYAVFHKNQAEPVKSLPQSDPVGERVGMILVDATCTIMPERHADFISEVRDIIPVVRKEPGCIRYELVADVHVPGVFHFIEEWESQKHLDEHIQKPHMRAYFAKTSPWHSAPAELKIYAILSSRSVMMND